MLAPPPGSVSAQGVELQLGVHALAPFLLTRLLEPLLRDTAARDGSSSGAAISGIGGPATAAAAAGTATTATDVRVVWVCSLGTLLSPRDGLDIATLDGPEQGGPIDRYNISKAAMYYLSAYFAKRLAPDGIARGRGAFVPRPEAPSKRQVSARRRRSS